MLQVKNLSLYLKRDLRPLIGNLSFVLSPGDKAAVIGEEGNGKSTLLKLIYDSDSVSEYIEYEGEITAYGERIGYLSQELTEQEHSMKVMDFLAQSSTFWDNTPAELARLCTQVGLPLDMLYDERQMATLSGGEKVKLRLVRVLALEPTVLLLDEPTGDLDIDTLIWMERFILQCSLPILFVSHDESLLSAVSNKIIHLERVRKKTIPRATVSKCTYDEYVESRQSTLLKQEQNARKQQAQQRAKEERWRQIYQRVHHEQKVISRGNPSGGRLLKKKMHSVKAQGRRLERERENMTQLPDIEDGILPIFEAVSLPDAKTVLELKLDKLSIGERILSENIELFIRGGEHVCIVGTNGCGKTTLLRYIADIMLQRKDIMVGYMPQDYEDLLPGESSPVEFMARSFEKIELTRARTLLGSMKFTVEEQDRPCKTLSGGQKAKLFLVKLILDGCNVLLLDEPTRNLSPMSAPAFREALSSFGGAIISISHDRLFISEVCDRTLMLQTDGLHEIWDLV